MVMYSKVKMYSVMLVVDRLISEILLVIISFILYRFSVRLIYCWFFIDLLSKGVVKVVRMGCSLMIRVDKLVGMLILMVY